MDGPRTGRRPTTGELQLLGLLCSFAEQALRSARRAERAEQERALLGRLISLSPSLSWCSTLGELHVLLADIIATHLHFAQVAIVCSDDSGSLSLSACRPLDDAEITSLLTNSQLQRFFRRSEGDERSAWISADHPRSGAPDQEQRPGPLAWHARQLVIPWTTTGRRTRVIAVVAGPHDGLLPSEELHAALRVLVDVATKWQATTHSLARGIDATCRRS